MPSPEYSSFSIIRYFLPNPGRILQVLTEKSKIKKSRSEGFHFGDSLMLLPHLCLAPYHPLPGTPSSHIWNSTCVWYPIPCLELEPHPCLEPLPLSGVPTSHQISSPKVPSTQKRNLSFSEFPDVHFNLTSCGPSAGNNIFYLAWKNSQNSRKATPFPSIRCLYESPKITPMGY